MVRGQETIDRGQEEICQANLQVATANMHAPTSAAPIVKNPLGTTKGNSPFVGEGLVNPNVVPAFSPPILEVDNQDNAFFVPRDELVFDVLG